jgi:hypothetical protein
MKKSLKIAAVIAVVAICSGAYVAYRMWNKPHADAAEMEGIKVSAAELVGAYEADEAAANTKYLSKVVEVNGTVSEVNIQDSLTFVNLTYPEAMMGGVQVTVDQRSVEDAKKLKEGDQATFKGFCNGYLMDVVVKDAVLIE